MRTPTPDPRQLRLFLELIERRVTRDTPFADLDGSWGTCITRPPGKGWRVADFNRDRRTVWLRRRAVSQRPRKASAGGGGWRH